MKNNVIAFDRTRFATRRAAARAAVGELRDNVVSIADYRTRTRPRRTASGVFFTTGVLCTFGSVA
ncbi:hypothetical protein [Maritimibacter fusiformis]|uniref:Uncharacterized protein n=1 Tax=Maritimibacter fusiformis TaxID=2603819 RepID=A0A5D0RLN0_9RHOB|nr:hypothetical protein [Maritimibacter fusiformis]TYB82029.1 hypothetical protein FVF75_04655 [Maritimibacter fusiformis]